MQNWEQQDTPVSHSSTSARMGQLVQPPGTAWAAHTEHTKAVPDTQHVDNPRLTTCTFIHPTLFHVSSETKLSSNSAFVGRVDCKVQS